MGNDGMSRILLEDEPGFRLTRLAEVRCVGDSMWEAACAPSEYMLWMVKSGSGLLQIGEDSRRLRENGYGPVPGASARIAPENNGMVHGYLLTFAAAGDAGALSRREPPEMAEIGEWPQDVYHRLLPLVERLCREAESDQPGASLKRGRLFYTVLEELATAWAERQTATAHDPVASTCRYIEEHYREDVSRDRLARIAGLSPWHYSVLFKQGTGMTPMAYLADVRIRKAKEALLRPDVTLRDVARESGYRDEFYFSRKFRTTVGVSPTIYVKKTPERIASLCFPYDGNMMALRLTPCVSIGAEDATHRSEYFRRIPFLLEYQTLSEHNMNLLRQANPYLIVCGDDQDSNRLGKIAPTVSLSWTGMGWREHLLRLGGAIRKEKEAERWLAAYDDSVHEARLRIRSHIGNASCVAVALCEDKLLVYRSRNMGEMLYRDLQMADPFDADCPSFVKRRTTLEELHALDADYLLLHVYSDPQAGSWVRELERKELWSSLRAVREGRVFRIDGAIWREYSAFSQRYMLTELERMFATV